MRKKYLVMVFIDPYTNWIMSYMGPPEGFDSLEEAQTAYEREIELVQKSINKYAVILVEVISDNGVEE